MVLTDWFRKLRLAFRWHLYQTDLAFNGFQNTMTQIIKWSSKSFKTKSGKSSRKSFQTEWMTLIYSNWLQSTPNYMSRLKTSFSTKEQKKYYANFRNFVTTWYPGCIPWRLCLQIFLMRYYGYSQLIWYMHCQWRSILYALKSSWMVFSRAFTLCWKVPPLEKASYV